MIWAETYLLSMAVLALTAMGLSSIIISLSIEQLKEGKPKMRTDIPTTKGPWVTIVYFFMIFILSLFPLLLLYLIREAKIQIPEKVVWQFSSGIVFCSSAFGLLRKIIGFKKLYKKGKPLHNSHLSKRMIISFFLFPILLSLSILNALFGLGSIYLFIIFIYFISILTMVGLVMKYVQERALRETRHI